MNEIQKRALLYGGALAAIGAIGAAWANTSTDADVMTLLSSVDVQLRMAHGIPDHDAQGRPLDMSARSDMIAQAELFLQGRADEPAGCRFEMGMVNTLGYEIRMLTPEFTVYRDGSVAYSARTVDFGPLRPGDRNLRRVLFSGIACGEIAALRVGGGDRCVMGELTKFTDVKGECLARIRLRPSELLTFEKEPQ